MIKKISLIVLFSMFLNSCALVLVRPQSCIKHIKKHKKVFDGDLDKNWMSWYPLN